MPIITKIELQKKRKDRYSIFLDENYAFSVQEDLLIKFRLRKGLELSNTQIEEITFEDEYKRAYLMAINYLSYRMRTISEMESYLTKKEISRTWTEKIIVKLIENNLLDDQLFANAFVRDRMAHASKGPQQLKQELAAKGVKQAIINEALNQFDFDTQKEIAGNWLRKEQKKRSSHAHHKRMNQLRYKLYQKGFNKDVISEVFAENKSAVDTDREAAIFTKQAEKLWNKHQRKLEGYELQMKVKAALFQKGFQTEMIDDYIEKQKNKQELQEME